MFDFVKIVLDWLIRSWSMIFNTLLHGMGAVGVTVVGTIILRKVIDVFRRVR